MPRGHAIKEASVSVKPPFRKLNSHFAERVIYESVGLELGLAPAMPELPPDVRDLPLPSFIEFTKFLGVLVNDRDKSLSLDRQRGSFRDSSTRLMNAGGNNVAAEFFRGLLNRTGTPIAFAGMASTERLNDNLQLQRRCRGVYRLTGFDWFDPEHQRLYRSILKRLETMMTIKPNGFSLADPGIARRMNYASRGLFGYTGLILRKTEEVVRREKDKSKYADGFTLGAMEAAFSQLVIGRSEDFNVAIPRNPFGSSKLPETWAPADHTFGDD